MARFILSLVLVAFGLTMLYLMGSEQSEAYAKCMETHSQDTCVYILR